MFWHWRHADQCSLNSSHQAAREPEKALGSGLEGLEFHVCDHRYPGSSKLSHLDLETKAERPGSDDVGHKVETGGKPTFR